jgi:hypothetical protein
VAEAGQEDEVDVACDAWLAPPLDRNSANETGKPSTLVAKILKRPCVIEQIDCVH